MIKYYEVAIKKTAKAINNKADNHYQLFNEETLTFKTITEVKEYLKNTYKNVKRVKMYIDDQNNNAKQTGWIYCFKNKDYSHNSDWWWQQDWINVKEIQSTNILIN